MHKMKEFTATITVELKETKTEDTSNPIRILQYVRVLDNGGIEKFIFSYLDNIDRSKVKFDFLLTRNQMESYDEELKRLECRKEVVEMKLTKIPVIRCIESYIKLKRYFRDHNYKIIHFQSVGETIGGAFAILAAKHAGVPIRIVHGHSAPYSGEALYKKILQTLGRKAHMAWGTHWFACSQEAALLSFGKDACDHGKVQYIHNAIRRSDYRYSDEERNLVRKELGLQGKLVIGNVGRMSPEKNHLFMLHLLAKVLEERPDAILLFVGGHSASHDGYFENLQKYIHEQGLDCNVVFAGERKDANRLLNAMDVFLFPSLWEGFGIAAVEAQANGLPVVASTKVPRDTKLTDLIDYVDLEAPLDVWVKTILKNTEQTKRKSHGEEIMVNGYDLETEAVKLQKIYQRLAECSYKAL